MMIHLALHDALNNQERQGATVVLDTASGRFEGRLKPPPTGSTYHAQDTVLIETREGGWHTILITALVAVGARP